jgi:pSer/pThr/pTyr-binding forkhead associated (FHA) protein
MIRLLGGAPQGPPAPQQAAPPAPNVATPPSPYYAYPQPGTPPPAAQGPYPQAPFRWPDQPPAADYGPPHVAGPSGPSPYYAPEPPRPSAPPPYLPEAGDDDGKTRFIGGVNIDNLKSPKYTYTLQILDNHGQWRDWGPIHASGLNVGRAKNSADFPGLGSMAVRHMKFRYEKAGLVVEDLGSINGVYVRLTRPVELIDGMRFRVGNQTVEFHQPEPFEPVPALVGEDGEEYCSRDVEPLAFLDLIRPNGQPGLRFPITRQDVTVIGREGPNTHIALSHDNSVSGMHARLYREDSRFLLEDLKSRNGTFIHVLGASKIGSGDVILAGLVLFRVVDHGGG